MTNILSKIVGISFCGMLRITRGDTRAIYRTAITSSLVLVLTIAILAGAQAGDDVTTLALVCICPFSFVLPWAWPQIWRAWQNRGRSTLYGSSRWGYMEEFLDWVVPPVLKRHPAPGAFPLAPLGPRALELPRRVVLRHVLIFGPSGAGKTRGFIMTACAWSRGASFIAFDPKGEAWDDTSGNHRRAWRVAPADPDRSICFNWVPLCQDPEIADLAARAILTQEKDSNSDPFWTDAEITLLAGLFAHAGTFRTPTPAAMLDWMINRRVLDILHELEKSPSKTAREYGGMYRHSADNERLAASITVGGDVRLSWLLDPKVKRFTSASIHPPDFGRLRREPTAVYWAIALGDVKRLQSLSAVFFSLVIHQLLSVSGPVPVSIYADELGNLGRIDGLPVYITTLRGLGIAIVGGMQSEAQFTRLYGQSGATVIIDNFGTKIALCGLARDSAERVSKMLGETTESVVRRSRSRTGLFTVSVQRQVTDHQRFLMTPDEVTSMGDHEFVMRYANKRPLRLRRYHFAEPPCTAQSHPLGEALIQPPPPPERGRRPGSLPPELPPAQQT